MSSIFKSLAICYTFGTSPTQWGETYSWENKVHWNPSIVDFFVKAKSSTIEGFPLMRGFYVVKNPLAKPNMSINEGFSANEGFLCSEKSIGQAYLVYYLGVFHYWGVHYLGVPVYNELSGSIQRIWYF